MENLQKTVKNSQTHGRPLGEVISSASRQHIDKKSDILDIVTTANVEEDIFGLNDVSFVVCNLPVTKLRKMKSDDWWELGIKILIHLETIEFGIIGGRRDVKSVKDILQR